MKKYIYEGKTFYNFGNRHAYILSEEALIQYVDIIIEKYGKKLTLDKTVKLGNNCYTSTFSQARDTIFSCYYGTPIYDYQDELSFRLPDYNMFTIYKKRSKK